jgi:hypothetical protein
MLGLARMFNHAAKPPRISGHKVKVTGLGKQYRLCLAGSGADGRAASGSILYRNKSFHHLIHNKH